jgi:hypothetical protein
MNSGSKATPPACGAAGATTKGKTLVHAKGSTLYTSTAFPWIDSYREPPECREMTRNWHSRHRVGFKEAPYPPQGAIPAVATGDLAQTILGTGQTLAPDAKCASSSQTMVEELS